MGFKRVRVGRLPQGREQTPLRAFGRDQRGTALVEFALIAPILFLLVFGAIDFGRALDYYNQMTQLVGQGARAAAPSSPPFPAPPAGGWGNESYPGIGSSNGAIWGHWIFYTDPTASSEGTFCGQGTFGVCTAVLSR